jgi:hypothetical protein
MFHFLIVKMDLHEFLPRGQTVNKEYYTEVIKCLREAMKRKRPDLWREKKWMLHHDNVPAYSSLLIRDSRNARDHICPTTSGLAPADILLFLKQEFTLKGGHVENIQENLLAELPAIPQITFQ